MHNSSLIRRSIFSVLGLVLFCSAVNAQTPATQPSTDSPQKTRDALLAIIDRPKVDLSAKETVHGVDGDLTRLDFSYASEATQRVPGILLCKTDLLKDGKRHPVTIELHGTGGSKTGELSTLKEMAAADFIAVSIDGRYHGDRGNQADYNAAIAQAYADGKSHPLYLDTVWDVMRLIDYLQSRPDVDPNRIGLMGISKGGIETWLTAAIDQRVAVAIPCISAQSFAWGLQNDLWHHRIGTVQKSFDLVAKAEGIDHPDATLVKKYYDRLLPGITQQFDGPQMLPLIAPRPLLIISGENDPINPIQGVHLCEATTKLAYANANASDKFELMIEPKTGHAVTKTAHAAAMDWFKKWLGNP